MRDTANWLGSHTVEKGELLGETEDVDATGLFAAGLLDSLWGHV